MRRGPIILITTVLVLAGCLVLVLDLPKLGTAPVTRLGIAPQVPTLLLVDARGAEYDALWGSWSGAPGDSLVQGPLILHVLPSAPQTFTVDFLGPAFVGEVDPSWSVPVTNNTQFAKWTVSRNESCGEVPGWPSPPSDSITFDSGALATCVAFRILRLPDTLPAQTYSVEYTLDVR